MRFTKMQGAGNDFIILDNRRERLPVSALPALAKRLCTRRLSVGANALMVAEHPTEGGHLKMRFYNADGTEGEMCGNGARCLARYAYERGISGPEVCIETLAGKVLGWRINQRLYKISLNTPSLLELHRPAAWNGTVYHCAYLELGRPGLPHAVVHLPGLAERHPEDLRPLGAALRAHPAFPKGANVNFWDFTPDGAVGLLTYERGVEDFTLACGTGSAATAAVLTLKGLSAALPLVFHMKGGTLQIELERTGAEITALSLLGDTNIVAEGELWDEDLLLPPYHTGKD